MAIGRKSPGALALAIFGNGKISDLFQAVGMVLKIIELLKSLVNMVIEARKATFKALPLMKGMPVPLSASISFTKRKVSLFVNGVNAKE